MVVGTSGRRCIGGRSRSTMHRLVFADTEGLTIDPSLHHPHRGLDRDVPLLGVGRISLAAG